jgi:hypothetical protein
MVFAPKTSVRAQVKHHEQQAVSPVSRSGLRLSSVDTRVPVAVIAYFFGLSDARCLVGLIQDAEIGLVSLGAKLGY